jgi:hypothetical protein
MMSPRDDELLKEYLEAQIAGLARLLDERHKATELALSKAEAAVDKRLEGMNEFRRQLSDQAHTFLPRQEYQLRHEALIKRIDDLTGLLTSHMAETQGRTKSLSALGAIIVGAVTGVGALISVIVLAVNWIHFAK